MSEYRRVYVPGGSYFFTAVTRDRIPLFRDSHAITLLRRAFQYTKQRKPFRLDVAVVLPDHLHCIMTLPPDDADYSERWKMLKTFVTRQLGRGTVWQSHYWEHLIRDERDMQMHVDYIHYNPVKHGYVRSPRDWQWSSFRHFVERGYYDETWGTGEPAFIRGLELE